MLTSLEINNVALIDRLNIELEPKMTVLTGETGAGKSIIIDSVNLILGARANKGLIRYGEDKARVQAVFTVSGQTAEKLAEMGIETEDGICAVLRDVGADGRSICRINGIVVSASTLRSAAQLLVNIHGQQDSSSLLDAKFHLGFLDSYAQNTAQREDYAHKYSEYVSLKQRLERLKSDEAGRAERIDLLKYQTEEISAAALSLGEKEELLNERALVQNAEQLTSAVGLCCELLYDGEQTSAYDLVSRTVSEMADIAGLERAQKAAEKLADIKYAIEDATDEIRAMADGVDFSQGRLDEIEDRLSVIERIEKKYGGSEKAALEYLDKASEELFELDMDDDRLAQLEEELAASEETVRAAAAELTLARKAAGGRLAADIETQLRDLDMPKVRFAVDIAPAKLSALGADSVEFMICPNTGEELKSLAKFASGGELSRVMLAMKTVLTDDDGAQTLIFDEIDTGVSGSAAQKIAQKMRSLAEKKQVICVSHLPQLAAAAQNHLLIKKTERDGRTFTGVTALDAEGRIAELARIIDGSNPSAAALEHARVMIENA